MSARTSPGTDPQGKAADPVLSLVDILKTEKRCCAWKEEPTGTGDVTKVPYRAPGVKASSTNPKTWITDTAAMALAKGFPRPSGIGIFLGLLFLYPRYLLIGIDLDTCLDPKTGVVADWAIALIVALSSYTEVSPSGTGVKIYALVRLTDLDAIRKAIGASGFGREWKRKTGQKHPPGIEVYLDQRYFAVTHESMPVLPDTLRVLNVADFEALVIAADAWIAGTGNGAGADSASPHDDSRSAKAMRIGGRVRRDGGSYEDMCDAIRDDPDTGSWYYEKGEPNDERELKRIWHKAGPPPERALEIGGEVKRAGGSFDEFIRRVRQDPGTDEWFRHTGDEQRHDAWDRTPEPMPDDGESAIPLHEVFEWSDTVPDRAALRPLPWVVAPYLMRGEIMLLHGPGGHGKSLIIVYWCVALALGQSFGRLIPPPKPLRVLLGNFEDRKEVLEQRIVAALDYFGATPADLNGNLRRVTLGTRCDATMFFAPRNSSGQVTTTHQWRAWQWHHEQFRPDVSALDPFISINAAGENENLIIRRIMTLLRTQVTLRHNCAGLLAHHDIKFGSDDAATDVMNARGGGDITNAARIEAAVKNMSEQEALDFGCTEDERRARFRLGSEHSKHNYSGAVPSEWFERDETDINGMKVVICRPWTAPPVKANSGQITQLLALIEQSAEPLSPRLSLTEARSVRVACEAVGLTTEKAQKAALDVLRRRGMIEVRNFQTPKGPRQGLRSAAGLPAVQWL
jgi:hypothetical protein